MKSYTIETPYTTPILVYDAPVDEKTKKIREMFDVDEKTGYPRHYNWRPMARLGSEYRPQDPFRLFNKYNPDEYIATKVFIVGASILLGGIAQFVTNAIFFRRPFWVKPYPLIGISASLAAVTIYGLEATQDRQHKKNQMYVDYMENHPERFGPIHRPKIREILGEYIPVR